MSQPKLKPREFWIYEVPSQVAEDSIIRIIRSKPSKEISWVEYHVVEYSALQAAEQRIAELESKLETAELSLERFYAHKGSAERIIEKMATALREFSECPPYTSPIGMVDRMQITFKEYEEWKKT